MTNQDLRDQATFDEAVNRKFPIVIKTIAGLAIVSSFMMSLAAIEKPNQTSAIYKQQGATISTRQTQPKSVYTKIIGSYKKGPDGKLHDAYTVTDFRVKAGQTLRITVDNTDDVPHSMTSPTGGINIVATPGTHTYSVVLRNRGRFVWFCDLPCDTESQGWAMQHQGYMSGYFIVG